MLNGSALRIDDEGRFVMFFVNSSDVGSCLCFDRDAGLFMDASWFGSGAYCYSNQQTGWACDLAGELLDNFGLVWDYLTGNGGDIGVLIFWSYYYSNNTLNLTYNESDSKMTLTRVNH